VQAFEAFVCELNGSGYLKKNSYSEMWADNLLIFQKLDVSGACYIY